MHAHDAGLLSENEAHSYQLLLATKNWKPIVPLRIHVHIILHLNVQ